MSDNYHDPIPLSVGQQATAALMNERFADLDAAISGLKSGEEAFDQLYVETPATATIAGDEIDYPDKARVYIDTEGGASTDNLRAINDVEDGKVLVIQITANARTVTVQHLATDGNIYLAGQRDITLDDTRRTIVLIGDSTAGRWIEFGARVYSEIKTISSSSVLTHRLVLPEGTVIATGNSQEQRLALMPDLAVRNWFYFRAAAATIQAVGVAAPTIANVPTNANDADGAFIAMPTTNISGNPGGFVTPTFNLVRRGWNPTIHITLKTPANAADILTVRYWAGLTSVDVTNVDTLAATTRFIGWRYSTIAGDAGWRPITNDGTNQTVGNALGGTLAHATKYLLSIRLDTANNTAYFSVNGGTEQAINTTMPADSQDLGLVCRPITQAATIRTLSFSRAYVEFN